MKNQAEISTKYAQCQHVYQTMLFYVHGAFNVRESHQQEECTEVNALNNKCRGENSLLTRLQVQLNLSTAVWSQWQKVMFLFCFCNVSGGQVFKSTQWYQLMYD